MPTQLIGSYAEISRWENLYTAFRDAAKGKRGRAAAAEFEFRLEDNLCNLQRELENRTYRPGYYYNFVIHEPKRRLISAAPFRDRVVHHALCQVIEPAFERGFIFHSYANRVGKGTHRALDKCQKWVRRYRYVLQCDIRQFFPSIDHEILKNILFCRIQGSAIRGLVKRIIASGESLPRSEYDMVYFPSDDLFAINRPRGLPIGNLTSQFWANCYLDGLDHFVNRQLRCGAYLRYMDDFLLFSDAKKTLWDARSEIIDQLARYRLVLHRKKAEVRPTSTGVRFLGFVVYPGYRLLLRRKGIAYRRKLKRMTAALQRGAIVRADLEASLRGWINHVRYGDTWGLRRTMLKELW